MSYADVGGVREKRRHHLTLTHLEKQIHWRFVTGKYRVNGDGERISMAKLVLQGNYKSRNK